MNRYLVIACALLVLPWIVPSSAAQAQGLPAPSRTAYKCVVAGKTVYTDEPCVGAQKVDTEPTRGMNKSTGKELTGADVARERNREVFAEALKPLTGMDQKQLDQYGRRMKLPPEQRARCERLDRSIADSESKERIASSTEKTEVQRVLFLQRQEHRKLRCE